MVAQFVTAPVQPWDALICPSKAVHSALSGILSNTEEHLRARLGATTFARPLMPVIPLGVHAHRFTRIASARDRWRSKLGIADDAVVVLFFGRLSVHAKASPFQLAQALEMAAGKGARLEMIWCGYFANEFQQQTFMTTAKAMAPSVRFHHLDGRKPEVRFSIWSAADIFCSLSTTSRNFGLTVIEAMAAELPVVVSNWDGYRDAIEHGVTGVLIDSYMPAISLADVAFRHLSGLDSYDSFIGAVSQFSLIDVQQLAHWLVTLAGDAELRRKLGSAARQSALKPMIGARCCPLPRSGGQRSVLEQARAAASSRPACGSTTRR
jgi:glycosyltransferase involved in cell wall biosynthesis